MIVTFILLSVLFNYLTTVLLCYVVNRLMYNYELKDACDDGMAFMPLFNVLVLAGAVLSGDSRSELASGWRFSEFFAKRRRSEIETLRTQNSALQSQNSLLEESLQRSITKADAHNG